jgi:serine/threonine-protein kinase
MPLDVQDLVFQVAMAQLLMTRAALVPSSGQRSFWIGCITLLSGAGLCITGRTAAELPWLLPVFRITVPSFATVIASMLASRQIYGLQLQVNEARRLGPYTLLEKVGAGGMGEVFTARHALLRRPTAIKLIRPDSATPNSLLQFEREAQLTSQLTHPSTIQIHDFGRSDGGVIYYAMEYIEGLTLHELVELAGPQPAARVIAILLQICGSLAEAHAVGLVHRDIKPGNIMLCERGRLPDVIKVLDFGLVKLRGQRGNTLESKSDFIVGTPSYMSPEAIIQPSTVDGRTDIYALGAVGYFLLSGQPLFAGASDLAVLLDQVNTPPVPISLRLGAGVPRDLDEVILSCLAKDPRLRPQSADALSLRLLACRDAHGWSQARARDWWTAHRKLVQQRLRERASEATPP